MKSGETLIGRKDPNFTSLEGSMLTFVPDGKSFIFMYCAQGFKTGFTYIRYLFKTQRFGHNNQEMRWSLFKYSCSAESTLVTCRWC